MKYFDESELEPVIRTGTGIPSPENLLTESELADIQAFSAKFSRTGESVLSASKSMRQAHLRTFVMLLHSLGAITLQRSGRDMIIRGTGRLAQHLPEILSIYLSDSLTLLDNWNNTHTLPEDTLSALELMRQMELRRVELTRLHAAERALADPDANVRDRAVREAAEIVQAAYREGLALGTCHR